MTIQLNLNKGDNKKSALNLNKTEAMKVLLSWDKKIDADVDAHALALTNGKIDEMDDILSTYAVEPRSARSQAFSASKGGLQHSGDCRDGSLPIDEIITIDPSKLAHDVDEIALIVTVHNQPGAVGKQKSFSDIENVKCEVQGLDKKSVLDASLSNTFSGFSVVHIGNFVRSSADKWEFHSVCTGIGGSFNDVLAAFQ